MIVGASRGPLSTGISTQVDIVDGVCVGVVTCSICEGGGAETIGSSGGGAFEVVETVQEQ